MIQKSCKTKGASQFFGWIFSADCRKSRPKLQLRNRKPRVQPCETVCAPPAGWVASVHLQDTETRRWGLCARPSRSAVLPPKYQEQYKRNRREAGKIARPPGYCLPFFCARLQRIRLRQNAQVKSRAEGSKRKRDKLPHNLPAVRTVTLQARRERPARVAQRAPRRGGCPPSWVGQASRLAIRRPHSPGRSPGTPCP